MAATTQPNIGTKEGYAAGDNGWVGDFNFLNRAIDGLVQATIKAIQAAPPGSPARGDCYIVATGGSGAWAGWDGRFVRYTGSAWESWIPKAGWYVYNQADSTSYRYKSGAWVIDDFVRVGDVHGQIPVTGDGNICIASGNRLSGFYMLSWEGPNRVERLTVHVSTSSYGVATLKVIDFMHYPAGKSFQTIAVYNSPDSEIKALVLGIANRAGGTNPVSVRYLGQDGIRLGGSIAGYTQLAGLGLDAFAMKLDGDLRVGGQLNVGGRATLNDASMPNWGAGNRPLMFGGTSCLWEVAGAGGSYAILSTNYYSDTQKRSISANGYVQNLVLDPAGELRYEGGEPNGVGGIITQSTKFTVDKNGALALNGTVRITTGGQGRFAGVASTDEISGPFGVLREHVGSSAIGSLYPQGVTPGGLNYVAAWGDDGSVLALNSSTRVELNIVGVPKAEVTASALDLKSGVALTQAGTARITTGGQGRFAGLYSTDTLEMVGGVALLQGGVARITTVGEGVFHGVSTDSKIYSTASDLIQHNSDIVIKMFPETGDAANGRMVIQTPPNASGYGLEVSYGTRIRANLRVQGYAYLDGGLFVGSVSPVDMAGASSMKLRTIVVGAGTSSYTLPYLDIGESVQIIFQGYSQNAYTSAAQKAYRKNGSGAPVVIAENGESVGGYGITYSRAAMWVIGVQTDAVQIID